MVNGGWWMVVVWVVLVTGDQKRWFKAEKKKNLSVEGTRTHMERKKGNCDWRRIPRATTRQEPQSRVVAIPWV